MATAAAAVLPLAHATCGISEHSLICSLFLRLSTVVQIKRNTRSRRQVAQLLQLLCCSCSGPRGDSRARLPPVTKVQTTADVDQRMNTPNVTPYTSFGELDVQAGHPARGLSDTNEKLKRQRSYGCCSQATDDRRGPCKHEAIKQADYTFI